VFQVQVPLFFNRQLLVKDSPAWKVAPSFGFSLMKVAMLHGLGVAVSPVADVVVACSVMVGSGTEVLVGCNGTWVAGGFCVFMAASVCAMEVAMASSFLSSPAMIPQLVNTNRKMGINKNSENFLLIRFLLHGNNWFILLQGINDKVGLLVPTSWVKKGLRSIVVSPFSNRLEFYGGVGVQDTAILCGPKSWWLGLSI
jgi:hypothetical protein